MSKIFIKPTVIDSVKLSTGAIKNNDPVNVQRVVSLRKDRFMDLSNKRFPCILFMFGQDGHREWVFNDEVERNAEFDRIMRLES